MRKVFTASVILFGMLIAVSGCEDFLTREPLSTVTPENYLQKEADLAAYTVGLYEFPTHGGWSVGTFGYDNGTDNQVTSNYSNIWVPGEYRVPQNDSEDLDGEGWDFKDIRQVNYFLETVIPRWKAGKLKGTERNIKHYIGEAYFLRAYEYFSKVKTFGDFPIIKKTLPDKREKLVAHSNRRPRNKVVHFILSDLDSAITLLSKQPPGGKNRISKWSALLFKSRVALFEATWYMYHRGTPFVPGGPDWPGEGHFGNYSINLDKEIDFFLTQAMKAASRVAEHISLTRNSLAHQNVSFPGYNSSENPYFMMFAAKNMGTYEEVLLWRDYSRDKGIIHHVSRYLNRTGGNTGYTRGLVNSFLMQNGLPIYAANSGYAGDDYLRDVIRKRDTRLQLFMKVPGQLQYIDHKDAQGNSILIEYPLITGLQSEQCVTGYCVKKGFSYLYKQAHGGSTTGSIVFRAVEAYLNYIEASYLKLGHINSKADKYWRAIRKRAGVNPNYMKTVQATNMQIEAKYDMAAYSSGKLLTDKILYNIRRERRNELIAEGMRMADLKRWRALDQLKNDPWIVKGFKIWGPMQDWYSDSELVQPGESGTPTVSSQKDSKYLLPYRVNLSNSNFVKDGYSWAYAHYLSPIAIEHFTATVPIDKSGIKNSVLYQNPGWPTQAGAGAEF